MRATKWLIALVSLALVLAAVYWDLNQQTSPGPLHPSHASVVKLQGASGCVACHGSKASEMSVACLVCHQDIKTQVGSSKGLHGTFQPGMTSACVTCHTDHTGAKVQLVGARSFATAGIPDPEKFDHGKVCTFSLINRHVQLKCEQCHTGAHVASLKEGQKRFLGMTQSCSPCHKDVHDGTFGQACASCHGQALAFKPAADFKHTADFPLVGGHSKVACIDCHQKSGPYSVAALKSHPLASQSCGECHASPHRPAMILAVAQSLRTTEKASCVACHDRDDPTFLSPVAKIPANLHKLTGFALDSPHDKTRCVDCHRQSGIRPKLAATPDLTTRFAKFYPGRGQQSCGECHASPHKPAVVALAAQTRQTSEAASCSSCHGKSDPTFLSPPATFSAELHGATGFALDTPHDKTQCVQCHKEMGTRPPLAAGADLPERFAHLFPGREQQSCEKCHADPHGGQFQATALPSTIGKQSRCIDCHAPTHFTPSDFDLAKHEKTRMPLTGSHRAVSCGQCHKTQNKIVQFANTPIGCADCHTDVHRGKFDEPGRSKVVAGQAACARCHTTTSFADVKWKADEHANWTGYALNGAHATATCASCHPATDRSDARGRKFGVAATSCVSCHADIHAGQFAKQNITDCARCHTERAKFTASTFDHQRDSQFKLDAVHANVACASCHRDTSTTPDVKLIRYRPLGTRCQDCHDPGGLKGKGPP